MGTLAGLAHCTGLQQLNILLTPYHHGSAHHVTMAKQMAQQLSEALPVIQSLTTLELSGVGVSTDAVLQHVSTLSCLQVMMLGPVVGI
jgi:hypothetical protein